MKRLKRLFEVSSFILIVLSFFMISGCAAYQGTASSSIDYPGGYNLSVLDNYGDWIYLNPYGEVWQPFVVSDWMPFQDGHWVYSDNAWTWVSYEPFGWIVCHYGYWYNDPFYGWVWIPSNSAWSPARVEWLDYGDYIGWSPLPPPGVNYGEPWEGADLGYWNVVRKQNFTSDNIRDYRIENPIRNTMGGRGRFDLPPNRNEIERATGGKVDQMNIPREHVQIPPRGIERMHLPPAESRRVEQKAPIVERRDLIPREEFHRQHPQNRRPAENRQAMDNRKSPERGAKRR